MSSDGEYSILSASCLLDTDQVPHIVWISVGSQRGIDRVEVTSVYRAKALLPAISRRLAFGKYGTY